MDVEAASPQGSKSFQVESGELLRSALLANKARLVLLGPPLTDTFCCVPASRTGCSRVRRGIFY